MSGWAKTHAIRVETAKRKIEAAMAEINKEMQHMPSHFVVGVDSSHRVINLIDKNDHPEQETE